MPFSRISSKVRESEHVPAQTLIGGAPVSSRVLTDALTRAPRIVAVDSGADVCLAAGLIPEMVVGDLDSISDTARAAFGGRLRRIAEQDSTDFAKALRTCSADLTLAVGFIGARTDHFLACLSELARSGTRCILLSEEDCITLCPPRIELDVSPGTRVSVWPLGSCHGRSTGLRWPIDGLDLAPTGRVGTSNEATGAVSLELEGPAVLILPSDCLPRLIESLDPAPRPGGYSPL